MLSVPWTAESETAQGTDSICQSNYKHAFLNFMGENITEMDILEKAANLYHLGHRLSRLF